MSFAQTLLVLSVALPAALSALWLLPAARRWLRPVAPWAALPALVLALTPGVEGTAWATPGLVTGLRLEVDTLGRPFLLAVALLWTLVGAFAGRYHRDDPHAERFFGFFVLTMVGNLGVVLAADALSFYLFFAWMTFAAYGLVVHGRSPEAFRAGRVYIALAVLGELAVLAAIFLLVRAAGGVPGFGIAMSIPWMVLQQSGGSEWVAALVVVGFGVKAGLVPLHMWLPLAHPVAPTAASALLSGAMIKAGVLAWLRFLPTQTALPVEPFLPTMGLVLIGAGAMATLYGVAAGVGQDDPKTVLAYSSVSQMGFMTVGTGFLVLSPAPHPAALLAVVVYVVHHALAKGALFLAVGIADHVPPPAGLAQGRGGGGGAARAVLMVAAVPALALAGAPLTTGALAKGVLKSVSYDVGGTVQAVLAPLLVVAAAGTTLLMARFLLLLHRRMSARAERAESGDRAQSSHPRLGPVGLVVPWALLIVAVAAGPWWLPGALASGPDYAIPRPWAGWTSALAPLLGGVALAWWAGRRLGRSRRLVRWTVPPGDLIVPLERLFEQVARQGSAEVADLPGLGSIGSQPQPIPSPLQRPPARDLLLARGPVVAAAALALILTLAVLIG